MTRDGWPPAGHDRQRELFEGPPREPGKTLPEQIEGDHAYRDEPDPRAPRCDDCGDREASVRFDGGDYCPECVDVVRLLARAGERLRDAADAAAAQGVPIAADAGREATTVAGLVETAVNHGGDESDD